MKKIMLTAFILALSMLIIPFFVSKSEEKEEYGGAAVKSAAAKAESVPARETAGESFRIKTKDKTVTLSADEYITGVVAAEMPLSYGEEALKAQSVAAYSFALYRKGHKTGGDFDLTDSYKTDQSYLDEAALKEKWGSSFESNMATLKRIVEAVSGEYLSFGGEPALALYHSLSPGKTNPCADVFGSDLKYLVSVNSKSDTLSPDYKSVVTLSDGEVEKKLSSPADKGGALKISKTGKSGCVKSVKYGKSSFTGVKLAGLLGLASPNFTLKHSSGKYTFTCLGRGHGAGLSQYGAGQMASAGSNYKEILAHYYPGTVLEKNS
ncbi:MAG: stage II sporulation protein D [Clostridia bacterium]|nr:stage II sporulation protein D [Clostridia bacterium]